MAPARDLSEALRILFRIRRGDAALIVHDQWARGASRLTREALEQAGAAVGCYELPEGRRPLEDVPDDLLALLERQRPALVFNQLKGYGGETPFRIALLSEETALGARVGHSPDITPEILRRTMAADFTEMARRAARVRRRLRGASQLRMTAPGGTDIAFSSAGRACIDDLSVGPGQKCNIPPGEAYLAPVEESADGVIVCDGSIGDIGPVGRPLAIRVAAGRALELKSADQALAERVARLLAIDAGASLIGELGIGLNPEARLTGNLLEDEKALGTAHVAFGNNLDMPGGRNDSVTHRDFVIRSPTLANVETGEVIVKDGHIV